MKKETSVPAKEYNIILINSFEEFETPQTTTFTCYTPEHVKTMISAYHGFYSGDPIETYINGEIAVTEKDWGLKDISYEEDS